MIYCKIRTLMDDRGNVITEAPPSTPVEVVGFSELPTLGEDLFVVKDEEEAKRFATFRKYKQLDMMNKQGLLVNDMEREEDADSKFSTILYAVLKVDVAGSIAGVQKALQEVDNNEVPLKIVRSSVGQVGESDIKLANQAKGFVLAFNVKPFAHVKDIATQMGVPIYEHRVVYQLVDHMRDLISDKLEPRIVQDIIGSAVVKEIFSINQKKKIFFNVAGCEVLQGVMKKGLRIRVMREKVEIFNGRVESMRHFKDAVTEVKAGFECGLSVVGFEDFIVGDVLQSYSTHAVPRKFADLKA